MNCLPICPVFSYRMDGDRCWVDQGEEVDEGNEGEEEEEENRD